MPGPARRIYPVGSVAVRQAAAVERRASTVYVPGRLPAVQAVRAAVPSAVARFAHRTLARTSFTSTGPLGAGGRAAAHPAADPRPTDH
ncbi:hypothetical protein GCM10010515_72440 [Streptomyces fructofermentans]|uniref:Uncharacterized protein n=1 Tax=Streptomyces fructofermentans TaxID=152141 RepID=A0A918NTZ0_9ACTN|nr:hypothetical protein GCM10010515_72440 [Streptomyces fructofermentans]